MEIAEAESFDTRSDDKGIEPEGLAVAEIDDRIFVFVALERIGGFMCWDISDPYEPVFQVRCARCHRTQSIARPHPVYREIPIASKTIRDRPIAVCARGP